MRDTIARLCAYSSDRIPQWLVPVIRANLKADRSVQISAAVVASWARYAEGVDEQGEPIDVEDNRAEALKPLAQAQRDNASAFIENTALFGDLAQQPRFVEAYRESLASLHEHGARATLEALINGDAQ